MRIGSNGNATSMGWTFIPADPGCGVCTVCVEETVNSNIEVPSFLFYCCLVDLDVPPSNRGTNSLVLPIGFPRPPDDQVLHLILKSRPITGWNGLRNSSAINGIHNDCVCVVGDRWSCSKSHNLTSFTPSVVLIVHHDNGLS